MSSKDYKLKFLNTPEGTIGRPALTEEEISKEDMEGNILTERKPIYVRSASNPNEGVPVDEVVTKFLKKKDGTYEQIERR
jgi:hypothetical protein